MNTSTSNAAVMSSREFYRQRETAALCRIPGVRDLMKANPDQYPVLAQKYPDAAFALHIVSNLFFHDGELTNIHMAAYTSILNGGNLADARFRYCREMDAYHERHNWD